MTETLADSLHKKLSDMNIRYEKNSMELYAFSEEENKTKNNMKTIEIAKTKEIINAKNAETGKPRYKNQAERDLALSEALYSYEFYNDYKEQHKKISFAIEEKKTNLDILKFQQRAIIVQMNYQIELIKVKNDNI